MSSKYILDGFSDLVIVLHKAIDIRHQTLDNEANIYNKGNMNKKISEKRFHTEPNPQKLYHSSIRVQGVVWVQDSLKKPSRADILTLKPHNKVQFHCFKRYRTFSYTFDQVIDEHSQNSSYGGVFTAESVAQALGSQNDYMLYCCGTIRQHKQEEMPRHTFLIFQQQLEAVFNAFVKPGTHAMKMNIVAVGEDIVYDLVSCKNVELRDITSTKAPHSCDIHFMGIQYQEIETLYQLYSAIQTTTLRKTQLLPHSYYVLYCDLTSKTGQHPRRRMLFVDATKDLHQENKSWDNNSHLVLNKCILGLYGKMENKDSYCPYRDSKITRIMKPFLVFNTRIDVYGVVNRDDEENPLQTLNFVKNFSRIKIQANLVAEVQDSEAAEKMEELARQNLAMKEKLKTLEAQEHLPRINLHEEIVRNANRERKALIALQKARRLNKLIKTKQWMSRLGLGLGEESQHLKHLQEEELKHQQQVEQSLIEESAKLEQSRIATIQKSISKVQKLKLMKEYFTLALETQKEETRQFLEQQHAMKQIYEENLKTIQRDLKKSPHQLLGISLSQTPKSKSKSIQRIAQDTKSTQKRNSSHNMGEKSKFPQINPFQRRKTLVKNRVLKGRVQYQSFLSKNTEQYLKYQTPIKMQK